MGEKQETRHLVGVGPATPGYYKPDTRAKKTKAKEKARQQARFKEAERVIPRGSRIEAYEAFPLSMETYCSAVGTASSEEESRHLIKSEPAPGHPVPSVPADEEATARRAAPRRACNWLRLLFFPRSVPKPILSAEELDAEDAALHEQEVLRCSVSRSELAAIDHKIVQQCLEWYNSMHPDNQYERAPGAVATRSKFSNTLLWTHGNFVARRKRSGCFSFLPSPRTLFFFELLDRYDVDEVITCTPLGDCVCKTCYRQFHVPHMDLKRTCACGDSKVEGVCKMCYLSSYVLHPSGGGFAFGYNKESFAYC